MPKEEQEVMACKDGEEKVMATAQHIVKTLGTTDTMADDIVNIFSNFDKRFKSMTESMARRTCFESLEEALGSLEERILKWDISKSENAKERSLWSDEPAEAHFFLDSVDDLQKIVASLSFAPERGKNEALLERAQSTLHLSMMRLQEEFKMLLEKHSETVDPEWLFDPASQPTSQTDEGASQTSADDENDDNESVHVAQPITDLNFTIDLMPPEIVYDLHEISKRMVSAGYLEECRETYSSIRRMFLEESISRLGFQQHSVEDVQKKKWEALEIEISKWIQVMKVAVSVFYPSEWKLCEKVFAGDISLSETCFVELARGVLIRLLSFAEAVAVDRRSPERLFKILDIYETLRDLLPDINNLFPEDICSDLRTEISTVIMQLMEAARGTFVEFENAIERDSVKVPVPGGAVHPLTRYVMNYMRFACDYKETLEQVLADDKNRETGLNRSAHRGELSPWSIQTIWIMDLLEANLEAKSKLYKDSALTWLFLLNNSCYIIQKAKSSDLGYLLGDEWIRKQTAKIRQCHTNYQRSAWGKALSFLRDEGVHSGGNFSSGISRAVLKERFKNFNALFEEIHRVQSSWIVADDQLRTDLRISIAEMVVTAYRSFYGRFKVFLENGKHPDKYIKYSPEDLESCINDLFEGSSGSLAKKKLS
eukprot:TRINITY_DN3456_c0_g1_i1.p1 TRINITY_DN3456_c0_g1~~TRINITY_DN3456_c0_g1_i1.p1  ORF type:complete len:654 (-),score=102.39 TRINITY_DN3456_c0_g1_i1:165-2126(-)